MDIKVLDVKNNKHPWKKNFTLNKNRQTKFTNWLPQYCQDIFFLQCETQTQCNPSPNPTVNFVEIEGWGCGSNGRHLPRKLKVLSSNPSNTQTHIPQLIEKLILTFIQKCNKENTKTETKKSPRIVKKKVVRSILSGFMIYYKGYSSQHNTEL